MSKLLATLIDQPGEVEIALPDATTPEGIGADLGAHGHNRWLDERAWFPTTDGRYINRSAVLALRVAE